MTRSWVATRPPGGEWTVLGRGQYHPGHPPANETWAWNQWGPDTGSFTIHGRPDRPDLLIGAPVRVHSLSGVVWGGRVRSTAPGDGGISVQCEGYQYALDDLVWRHMWVRDRIEGFVDMRSVPGISLTGVTEQAQVGGAITLAWPTEPRAIATGESIGAVLDLGVAEGRAIAVDYTITVGHPNVKFYVNGWDDQQATAGGVTAYSAATSAMGSSGTVSGTFTAAKRFIVVSLYCPAGFSPATAPRMQVTGVRVAADSGYLSSGASVLVAGHVIDDVAADLGWVHPDASLRAAASTAIPHLTTEGTYESHRSTMQRVNAWHDWVMMVDQYARIVHHPRPLHATLQLGAWSGDGAYQDSGRDLSGTVDRVIVSGTDPAGARVDTTIIGSSPALSRTGVERARVLDVDASLTSTDAAALGAVWLTRMSSHPTSGSVTTIGTWALRDPASGAVIPPATVMTRVGEVLRVSGDTDPDTGGVGRSGVLQAATWTPATDGLSLTVDTPTDHLDALLTRMQAIRATLPSI